MWSYTNTGYVLLGLIIEETTGRTWAEEVRARILDPLGMTRTFVDGYEDVPGGFIPGYFLVLETEEYLDASTALLANVADAAGSMVSTTRDQLVFMRALSAAELVSEETLAAMTEPRNFIFELENGTASYGLGIIIYENTDPPYTIVGHGGDIVGYSTWVGYEPEHDLVHASMMNTRTSADEFTYGVFISIAWLDEHFSMPSK